MVMARSAMAGTKSEALLTTPPFASPARKGLPADAAAAAAPPRAAADGMSGEVEDSDQLGGTQYYSTNSPTAGGKVADKDSLRFLGPLCTPGMPAAMQPGLAAGVAAFAPTKPVGVAAPDVIHGASAKNEAGRSRCG